METAFLLAKTGLALGFFVFIFRANLERLQELGFLARRSRRVHLRSRA